MTFSRFGVGLQGLSGPTPPRRSNEQQEVSLLILASPSKRLPSHRISIHRSEDQCASLGIRSRVCPAVDVSPTRPLPDTVASAVRPSHRQVTESRSAHVVFHHFDGLLRVEALGLLRPKADRGSLRFAMACTTAPRNAVHTLRRIPLASSRTASLRPLPSCRSTAPRPPSTEALN